LQQKVTNLTPKLYKFAATNPLFNKNVIQSVKNLTFRIANPKQCIIFATENFINLSTAEAKAK
jgi:hypothetical protein